MTQYVALDDLNVYKRARELSSVGWKIYEILDWRDKKIIGDQFITATDSGGANIAEGYGRFHYLDKVKFYYNARGSLFESKHWLDLLQERKLITREYYEQYYMIYKELKLGLNGLIKSAMLAKASSTQNNKVLG